jgi:hypothetical protein
MLIERQISIALGGISAALVLPSYAPFLTEKAVAASGSPVALLAGTLLGALAVLMGALISGSELEGATGPDRVLPLAQTALWSAFALCVTAGSAMVAMHMRGVGWAITIGIASLLPLVALATALLRCRVY